MKTAEQIKFEKRSKSHSVHGHTANGKRSATYRSWLGMIERCENQKHVSYSRYGERGIKVCERWHSFVNFLTDMGERPDAKTLNRKDGSGNYEPSNCEWATIQKQCNTRRNNVQITFSGKTQTPAEWARELQINVKTIYTRICRGFPLEKVFKKCVVA